MAKISACPFCWVMFLYEQMIVFHSPAHAPYSMTVTKAGATRMDPPVVDKITPPHPTLVSSALPLNFPGSEGFMYQAAAVTTAVATGKLECEEFTTTESLALASLTDAILSELGVTYSV
eukprot:SAG31_NODE_96_length_25743_cov_56.175948_11_plen_119_part_00